MSCQPHRVTSGQSNSCKPMRKGMMLLSEHLFCSVKCIMFDLTVKTYNKHNMGDSQLCDEDLISSCWFSGSPVPFWHKHAHNYRKEQQQIVCMSKQCMYFKHHIWHIQTNLSNLWTWSILIYKSGKRLRIFLPKESFPNQEGFEKLFWRSCKVNVSWKRVPDIWDLELEGTLASRFAVCFGDWKEPFAAGSERAGRSIGSEK